METLSLLFEFIPVILAIVAIPQLAINGARNYATRFAIAACVLLIIAQTGWIQSFLTHTPIMMTLFDKLWTVFNTVVVISYMLYAKSTRTPT